MTDFSAVVHTIEVLVKRQLSGWPTEWISFYWPGYTYEHTMRVRNLARAMARQTCADEQLVEIAALLHDISKPDGEPHAEIGAQRADEILLELGLEPKFRQSICDMIRSHITPDPVEPIENLILSDADGIDACYGYVSIVRYVTIRAHRGLTIEEMITRGKEWLSRYEKPDKFLTDLGHTIALERFEAMRGLLDRFSQKWTDGERDDPSVGIIRFVSANARRPSLFRQVAEMKSVLRDGCPIDDLQPSGSLQAFVERLEAEIAGDR